MQRRQLEILRGQERGLRLLLDARARLRPRRRRLHDGLRAALRCGSASLRDRFGEGVVEIRHPRHRSPRRRRAPGSAARGGCRAASRGSCDAAVMRRAPRQLARHHGAGVSAQWARMPAASRRRPTRDAFVVLVLVVLLPLAACARRCPPAVRHLRRPAQAGRPEEAERKAAEDDAERGIEAARKLAAAEPFGDAEGEVAGGAAEAGRERPAGEHRQAGERGRDSSSAAAEPGERLADRPARQTEAEEVPAADGEAAGRSRPRQARRTAWRDRRRRRRAARGGCATGASVA